MGFQGIGPGSLLLILLIIILLFGTKKLRSMGGDLGEALRNFRGAFRDEDKGAAEAAAAPKVIDNVVSSAPAATPQPAAAVTEPVKDAERKA